MALSVRSAPYEIPAYSLTGDLLSHDKCGLQYRYYKRGALPPSTPVQLWFGEFIHGVMEESYRRWKEDPTSHSFPPGSGWDWQTQIRPIELAIYERLLARNLRPNGKLFDKTNPGGVKRLASERAEAAINSWGRSLFPLIHEAEVVLKGIRPMPPQANGDQRSPYYEVKGIVDVITSVKVSDIGSDNEIVAQLLKTLGGLPQTGQPVEIIVDYKGMRRPEVGSREWNLHNWQVQTYAWLRRHQPNAGKVVAGILLYLNELVPSAGDMQELQSELRGASYKTDVLPNATELKAIQQWARGPAPYGIDYRKSRSLRIIPVDSQSELLSLQEYDNVVKQVEGSIMMELAGTGLLQSWHAKPERRTCTACDAKAFCPASAQPGVQSVP